MKIRILCGDPKAHRYSTTDEDIDLTITSVADAESQLRNRHWTPEDGKWYCPGCSQRRFERFMTAMWLKEIEQDSIALGIDTTLDISDQKMEQNRIFAELKKNPGAE